MTEYPVSSLGSRLLLISHEMIFNCLAQRIIDRESAEVHTNCRITLLKRSVALVWGLSIAKMLSGWNAFEISDIQDIQLNRPNPAIRCNNVALG